jgi:hydroxyethylthiazole kinase-like uncharacterized protein yjeF
MKPVLSRAEARAFDAHAITACGVPSLVLMENAGRGATDVIERELFGGAVKGRRIVVVAGTGNNGGDGFVVARQLRTRGADVSVWQTGDPARMTSDCRSNAAAFEGVGGKLRHAHNGEADEELRRELFGCDVIVDALFGTGLDRPISAELEPLVNQMNSAKEGGVRVASLDVPSGLDADTGQAKGAVVSADLTVTFAHAKLGFLTARGSELAGAVFVVELGVPATPSSGSSAFLVEPSDVRKRLLPRSKATHKYAAGHVAIVAGSLGKTGAAALGALGALRGGAGAATIVTWEDAAAHLEARVLEAMVIALPSASAGEDALRGSLDAALERRSAVVLGPGLGTGAMARVVAEYVLSSFEGTVIADADCFSLFRGEPEAFRNAKGRVILTPHAGELGRLLGCASEEIESSRFSFARQAASKTGAVVLLKGAYTVVAAPDGTTAITGEGAPVLATAGSGDVLSGLLGALACSLSPFEAAWAGAFLHGAAGGSWQRAHGDRGMRAAEIADCLPGVMRSLAVVESRVP